MSLVLTNVTGIKRAQDKGNTNSFLAICTIQFRESLIFVNSNEPTSCLVE